MKSIWKFWCNAKNIEKATVLAQHFKERLGVRADDETIGPYHKGGYVVSFCVEHGIDDWRYFIFEVIELGQRVACQWTLCGEARTQLDGWSGEAKLAGIQSVQWICDVQYQS